MADGAVSPLTPIAVMEMSDDDDDDDDDDDALIEISDDDMMIMIVILGDNDKPSGKTSTPGDNRTILSCDDKATPLNQAVPIAATDIRQNFYVVGDVDVQIRCHLYAVEQVEEPAASNSGIAHISGAMIPGSSVDGGSSNTSLHFSPAVGHSHQPWGQPEGMC
jgi:hypothetical protein